MSLKIILITIGLDLLLINVISGQLFRSLIPKGRNLWSSFGRKPQFLNHHQPSSFADYTSNQIHDVNGLNYGNSDTNQLPPNLISLINQPLVSPFGLKPINYQNGHQTMNPMVSNTNQQPMMMSNQIVPSPNGHQLIPIGRRPCSNRHKPCCEYRSKYF